MFFDIVKMVLALTCILGLVFGVVYLLKRFLPGAQRAASERVDMYVISQLPLGSRQRVAVVRVQDRTLVLGISEASINILTELTPKRAAGQDQKEADDPKIFNDLLTVPKDGGNKEPQPSRRDMAPLFPPRSARLEAPKPEPAPVAAVPPRVGAPKIDPAAVRDLFDSLSGPSK